MTATKKRQTQRTVSVSCYSAEIECLNCGRHHTVERDEDGAAIEQIRCQGDDDCEVYMCIEPENNCLTKCGRCELPCCVAHLAQYDNMAMCAICLDECRREDAESLETGADRCPPRE